MALQELAPLITYVLIGIVGWFTKTLWDADKSLREDLSRLKEDLPKTFVMRDDYRSDFTEIKEMLREIRNLLDGKVDK